MPVMETKNFGKISFEPESELEFPSGLPGFESRKRFVAVTVCGIRSAGLSAESGRPGSCALSRCRFWPLDPRYRLKVNGEDLEQMGLSGSAAAAHRRRRLVPDGALASAKPVPPPTCWRRSWSTCGIAGRCRRSSPESRLLAPACADARRGSRMLVMSRRAGRDHSDRRRN